MIEAPRPPSAVRIRFVAALIALAVCSPLAQEQPEYGPAKGTLLIVGGGNLNGSGINEKFIELAGGPEKNFVIVPTAGGNRNAQGELIAYDEQRIIAPWVRLGLKHVKMLHTADPKIADTEEFARVLRTADGVWFNGGRQWNIVDSYAKRWPTASSTKCSNAAASSVAAPPARRSRATTWFAATLPVLT